MNQVSHEYVKDPSLPQLPDQSLKFKYDENGNRIKKEVDGKTRYYINEGNTVLNELDENGDVVRTMVRGLEPVAEIEGDGTIRYLHQDALGSTVMETGSNGEVVREYDYDVYGGMLGLAGGAGSGLDQYNSKGTRYLYTDQEFDSESNLYYYNARYYNPSTGRFLSRDPILGQPGNVLSNNPYIYVQNNPLKFTDPTGKFAILSPEDEIAFSQTPPPRAMTPQEIAQFHSGVQQFKEAFTPLVNVLTFSTPETPKASISKSTAKNVGNPSGSTSAFKQIAVKAYEDVKVKVISTVLQYLNNTSSAAAQEYSISSIDQQTLEDSNLLTEEIMSKVYDGDALWTKAMGHYSINFGNPLYVDGSILDFGELTMSHPDIKDIQIGEKLSINSLHYGWNDTSLTFGKVDLQYIGNNKFTVFPDDYDFNIETDPLISDRNFYTIASAAIHVGPLSLTVGGPFKIIVVGPMELTP